MIGQPPDRDPTGPAEAADLDELSDQEQWFDDEAGPVVRLFSMTRGRTRPAGEEFFDLISMISLADPADRAEREPLQPEPVLDPEHHAILDLCAQGTLSVAELGSYTDLPVSIVRVLLGDLHDAGLIGVTRPVPLAELPDERLLLEVINGLRAL
ncbi:hypothetical protein ABH930_001205 [Kitasatospora sp. GAS204A]|uniref:DUF742 domain-containing protein n=1 Tax=unclassified Kitasatospora TaxID=2633591 RepID=UPI002472FC7B|nr:DUF742 domain-containing protein [Kitasatospora sp. GAS204B]MDH6119965.1 hypothetical protein [Kitasatospora sp. GAS204B]